MGVKRIPIEELDWDDLRIFLAVIRSGNLTQAAKTVHVDHSTISRRISRLELCLGGALFERRKDGLQKTLLAEQILPQVEAMEGGAVALRESLSGCGGREPAGIVRVAMMEGIGSLYIARRLVGLSSAYPLLRIELVTSPQLVNVNRREADIFLSFFKPEGRGMESENIGLFALSLYGSEEYFAAHGKPKSLEELVNHKFLSYIDDLIQVDTVRWLDEVLPNPNIIFSSNSMLAQMAAASSGLGLVLLPRFAVANEPKLLPILTNQICVTRQLWLSVHADLRYSTRINAVFNYLKDRISAEQVFLSRNN
ncbi:LysR family transcriptional regulator [Polynucleobacter difficilis]|uniref:LysR family transcriptional regulator n=1 Tax=Polynucleobacter difficilis TaxID=556054 RepID=UPI000D391A5C|nr:LysR family transcriptional regulator [Polynucleobacter difficilis]